MSSPDGTALPVVFLERLFGKDVSISDDLRERIVSCLDRLEETGRDMAEFFTPAEGALLCEVFKNAHFEADRFDEWPLLILWDLEDVEKYERLGNHFGVSVPHLLEKMEDFTCSQALWLFAAIDRFWEDRRRRGDRDEFYEVELR
ncbi:MAG: hypothetical protein AVO39_07070 [delta proteobacterium MLS_D]|jgi:hypothetical protein|nr:MAG: hypothetical protein AVO39_07070 [delta proteobacterium MLS_D]